MDQQRSRDPLRETLDVDSQGFGAAPEEAGVSQGRALAPLEPQGVQQFIVAQHVPVRRNYATIMARMRALAAAAGDKYVYGWEVNDRKRGRKVWIEGPTIKLANDLSREFGNCSVDVRSYDHGTFWMFYARFVDLETGSNYTRAFQQRKSQNTGMADADRQADITFQIGQSKAIRNVVVNVLQTFVDEIVDAAKSSLLNKIGNDVEKARKWLLSEIERLAIDRKRVETVYGRTADKWTTPDMAKLYTELRSISEGMMQADDVYPDPAAAAVNEEPERKTTAKERAKKETKGAGEKGVTVSVIDADGKLLGKHSGAPLKAGDPWNGPDGLYHVEDIVEKEGVFEATVKKKAVIAGGSPAGADVAQPPKPASTPAPGEAPKPQATGPSAPAKAGGPGKRRFFNEEN